jgi:thioredoxin reductase (NADPH)
MRLKYSLGFSTSETTVNRSSKFTRGKGGESIEAEGLFVLGGETAPDRLIPGLEIVENHIQVDRQQRTSIPGVYAAGDCTGKPYQVAKAIGEGQVAGLNASNYVAARA